MLSRSRPALCTATRPPVRKNDAWRSKSRIWKFCTPSGGFVGSNGTDWPAGAAGGGRAPPAPRPRRARGQQPQPPGLVARASRLGHEMAGELLVAGARPRAVVVARRDEAEAEA